LLLSVLFFPCLSLCQLILLCFFSLTHMRAHTHAHTHTNACTHPSTKWCYRSHNVETKVYHKYSDETSLKRLTENSRELILAVQCYSDYVWISAPKWYKILGVSVQRKASAPTLSHTVLPNHLSTSPH
jgi:hypothetical protein